MLEDKYRLTSKLDFDKVKARGETHQSNSFILGFYKRKDSTRPSRFGFIVSTNISKDAVIRNKARRGLREGVRHNLSFMKTGYDCVFVAKPVIARQYTDQVLREVKNALSATKLLK